MRVQELFEELYLQGNKHAARKNTTTNEYVLPSIQDAYAGWKAAFEYIGGFKPEWENKDK